MARKWHLLHHSIRSFLNRIYQLLVMRRTFTLFLLSLFFSLQLSPSFSQTSTDSPSLTEINTLQQQSQANYKQGNFSEAYQDLHKLIQILTNQGKEGKQNLAIAWTNLGHLQFAWGKLEQALDSWQEALEIDREFNQTTSISYLQIYQAEALQKLGLYPRACETLTLALQINNRFCQERKITQNNNNQLLEQEISQKIQFNSRLSLDEFRVFGNLLEKTGRLKEAKILLERIVSIDPKFGSAFLSLGNTLRAMGNLERDRQAEAKYNYLPWKCDLKPIPKEAESNYNKALKNYQKAADNSSQTLPSKARLNQFSLLVEIPLDGASKDKTREAESLSKIIATDLPKLPTSQAKIYAEISYAKNLACLQQQQNSLSPEQIISRLNTAIDEAKTLEENLSSDNSQALVKQPKILESYTVGNLGGFYEYLSSKYSNEAENYRQKALQLTQEALYLAQPSEAPHIAYQWQWQLGRLFESQGETKKAITNYELAAQTLEAVRGDLLTINSEVQFSFRDNIEPLYRGLVNLLLSSQNAKPESTALRKALNYTESLQLAELENFLRCNLSANLTVNQVADAKAAIIYPIILENKLGIILKLPGQEQPLDYRETPIPQKEIESTLKELQRDLRESGNTPELIKKSQKVYQWLFQPLEPILNNYPELETLVFILDGSLRNIPMAALYDGEKYLLEKDYAIAVVPSLKLFNPNLPVYPLKVLAGGIGLPQEFAEELKFEKIQQLESEIQEISQFVPTGEPLLNEKFTKANIQEKLQIGNFSAIHWKTHGIFSSDPENTFIVAYRELIKANDLNQLIQTGSQAKNKPLELLVLSACETAQGDNRAVLGLAGIAVRAGARSTLSTLWKADDTANTKFMAQFYQELAKPGMTKAKALHQAQLALFQEYGYQDPHTWATYVLVGNWL